MEHEVWPPPPSCPAPPPEPRPPWLRARLTLLAPLPGLLALGLSGLGWLLLAHGLLWHVPPQRYYHTLIPLAALGMWIRSRGKRTRIEEWAHFSSLQLFIVYAVMTIMDIAHEL